MSVNCVHLLGRLGKDPTVEEINGKSRAKFSLATSKRFKDRDGKQQEKTVWHNIEAWGPQADVMGQYLKKGQEVWLEGEIDNRSYEDKDGNKKVFSSVVVFRFSFVGSKADNSGADNAPAQGDDDDLPF